jgi:hypothetical protein
MEYMQFYQHLKMYIRDIFHKVGLKLDYNNLNSIFDIFHDLNWAQSQVNISMELKSELVHTSHLVL